MVLSLSTFFYTNILSIALLCVFNGTSFRIPKKHYIYKILTLLLVVIMLFEFLYYLLHLRLTENLKLDAFDFTLSNDLLNFKLLFGLEGFTVIFCFLTVLLTFICLLLIWDKYDFFGQAINLLILQLFVVAAFTVQDIFFFFVFFEAIAVPMYALIMKYGSRHRKIRASKLLLFYTLVSSCLLLIAIGAIYYSLGSTSYSVLQGKQGLNTLPQLGQNILWWIFTIAFATKMPLVPFHLWLPEAHVEASTTGSVLLAGILLKLGLYGLIVFPIQMLPGPSQEFAKYIYVLAITGATYTCAVAIRQKDLKRIIAYSSVSHMCSVVVALFSFRKAGLQAALYQGISHGFVSVALFILVGYIYDRFGTRNLEKYGGIGRVMPYYTVFLLFFSLSNLALPGLSSFVGEFGILFAVFSQSFVGGLVILVTVIVTGAYTLLLNNQVTFGNLQELTLVLLKDLNRREFYITLVLAFFVMVLGVYSDLIMPLFSDVASPTLGHIYYWYR